METQIQNHKQLWPKCTLNEEFIVFFSQNLAGLKKKKTLNFQEKT